MRYAPHAFDVEGVPVPSLQPEFIVLPAAIAGHIGE